MDNSRQYNLCSISFQLHHILLKLAHIGFFICSTLPYLWRVNQCLWAFFPWENNICKLMRLSNLAGVVHGNDGDLLHLFWHYTHLVLNLSGETLMPDTSDRLELKRRSCCLGLLILLWTISRSSIAEELELWPEKICLPESQRIKCTQIKYSVSPYFLSNLGVYATMYPDFPYESDPSHVLLKSQRSQTPYPHECMRCRRGWAHANSCVLPEVTHFTALLCFCLSPNHCSA